MIYWLLLAFFAAALSSALTLALAWFLFRTRVRPRLEEELRLREERLEQRLSAFGERLERHVRQGVVDGVASIPSSEVIREGTRSLAKTGIDIVNAGLDGLLGPKSRHRP